MQLNHECIRDILLEVEKHSTFHNPYIYNPDNLPRDSFLSKYSSDEVMYHIRQCDLAGYLLNTNWKVFQYVAIEDLMPVGHDLIANIRAEETWTATKKFVSKLGGAGLKMLSATAEGVATAFLNKYVDAMVQNL